MKKLTVGLVAIAMVAGMALPAAAGESEATTVDVVLDVSGTEGFDANRDDYELLREALIATDLAGAVATTPDITVFASHGQGLPAAGTTSAPYITRPSDIVAGNGIVHTVFGVLRPIDLP